MFVCQIKYLKLTQNESITPGKDMYRVCIYIYDFYVYKIF